MGEITINHEHHDSNYLGKLPFLILPGDRVP
jgi:hypothetical protein